MVVVAWSVLLAIVGVLGGCASRPASPSDPGSPAVTASAPAPDGAVVLERGASRWVSADWSELPDWQADDIAEAWGAWLHSCERATALWQSLCPDIRRLSIADTATQRAWIERHLQAYRVESLQGAREGLLTGYFEPLLQARRQSDAEFSVPLFRPPPGLRAGQRWYSRQEIDTLPEARAALRGRELVYLSDPVDALVLHIQGSGRVRVTESDGSQRWVRLAFAGTNEHPYRSVGRWLLDQGLVRDASWPGIRAWLAQNPQRVQELLWSNPRVVFFKEEPLPEAAAGFGPRGAQGVALTPGRSIAVDPASVPYGTPVWLASEGPQTSLRRLVLAQDTGSAITGAVRADYFAGWGPAAADLAGRLRQGLQMWALWPKARQ